MSRSSEIRVAVIGAGSWGTTLWPRRGELVEQINTTRVDRDYLSTFLGMGDLIATCSSKNVAVEPERTELRPS
jgi:glycerol-3-phosphate dehydrogenase